jgi:HK97 family phage major capsid protein
MSLATLIEKRTKLMADAQASIAGDITPETRSKFDAMLADVAVLDGDITRHEAVEKYNSEQRSAVSQNRPNPGESADAAERVEVRDARQKAALRTYLQTGVVESRDLTTAALGGVIVPVGFTPQVIEAKKSYGQILEVVNTITTDHGNPIKLVQDDDTANSLAAVTVGTDAVETDPALTGLTLQVDNLTTGVVKIDRGLLSDSGFDVDSFIKDKFMRRYFRGTSNLIIAGNAGNIASLATAYAAGFTGAASLKVSYPDFATALATLDPAYQGDAVWAMNNATLGSVAGLVDNNLRPLFVPYNDGTMTGFVGSILGRPVKLVTQLPNQAAGSKSILFGDFKSAYTFRTQAPGISIFRMDERYLPSFEVGFVGFVRAGGIATPAGQAPVISIITHA